MTDNDRIKTLVDEVQSSKKYQFITHDLVQRLSEEAIRNGLTGKSAVKSVRNKLHQIGGAYFKKTVDYTSARVELSQLNYDLSSNEIKRFCLKLMQMHASTAERIPILDTYYETCFEPIGPVDSVLDLACGMNPLAIPWMPLKDGFRYQACDIYLDLLNFLNSFFVHFNMDAEAQPCDLLGPTHAIEGQIALLLKSIPCLAQVDKSIGLRLLETIPTKHILVSFPVKSLGGREKGMPDFYRTQFDDMVSGKPWEIQEFNFPAELTFLVTK